MFVGNRMPDVLHHTSRCGERCVPSIPHAARAVNQSVHLAAVVHRFVVTHLLPTKHPVLDKGCNGVLNPLTPGGLQAGGGALQGRRLAQLGGHGGAAQGKGANSVGRCRAGARALHVAGAVLPSERRKTKQQKHKELTQGTRNGRSQSHGCASQGRCRPPLCRVPPAARRRGSCGRQRSRGEGCMSMAVAAAHAWLASQRTESRMCWAKVRRMSTTCN